MDSPADPCFWTALVRRSSTLLIRHLAASALNFKPVASSETITMLSPSHSAHHGQRQERWQAGGGGDRLACVRCAGALPSRHRWLPSSHRHQQAHGAQGVNVQGLKGPSPSIDSAPCLVLARAVAGGGCVATAGHRHRAVPQGAGPNRGGAPGPHPRGLTGCACRRHKERNVPRHKQASVCCLAALP